jgi:hypothetical protein
VTCVGQPPATLDAWLALVSDCAQQYGGPDWPSLALTGLATVVVLAFAVLAVGVLVWRVGRG